MATDLLTRHQAWNVFHDGAWNPVVPAEDNKLGSFLPSRIHIITWNIDMLCGGKEIRMPAAICHLKNLVDAVPTDIPIIIFLQENLQPDLELLKGTEWIRNHFYLTDVSNADWKDDRYGTTTLVDKRLQIKDCFRVYYKSQYGRDGLFLDVAVKPEGQSHEETKILRLCNTHLESLVANPPLRLGQVAAAARELQKPEVYAGVVAGDMNAIQPFDRTLHVENGLKDAYLEHGGQEDSDDGYTWGYQSDEYSMRTFGASRMDKILYCGNLRVENLERIGGGARVEEEKREEVKQLTNGLDWITDHYGLQGTIVITAP